mgnify:CR=1 FL=1
MPPMPTDLSARCPGCGCELFRVRGGEWTLANKIVRVDADGKVSARCPTQGCGADVPVPFLAATSPPEPVAAPPAARGRVGVRRVVRLDGRTGT